MLVVMLVLLLIVTLLAWGVRALRPSQFSRRLSSLQRSCLDPLFAAKKKKKKVLRGSGAAPQRVSSDMNISVRKQIQYAKAYKRLVNASNNSKNHTPRVKRPKAPKPEREEYVEIDYENMAPVML